MKRPSYKAAIAWLADNDDCDWLNTVPSFCSVSALLVADMFGVDDGRIEADLRRHIKASEKVRRNSRRRR